MGVAALVVAFGCAESSRVVSGVRPLAMTIVEVRIPRPAIAASRIQVTAIGLEGEDAGREPSFVIEANGKQAVLALVELAAPNELAYRIDEATVRLFGPGSLHARAWLDVGESVSDTVDLDIELAASLMLELDEVPARDVHHNDIVLLHGAGIPLVDEGSLVVEAEGTFTPLGEAAAHVYAELPAKPAERFDRTAVLTILAIELGGVGPGTFSGALRLAARMNDGADLVSETRSTELRFLPAVVFEISPATLSLEQIFMVRGAGFVGAGGGAAITVFRLTGTFEPHGAGPAPLGPIEIVPEVISGGEARVVLRAQAQGGRLISPLFGSARGVFRGQIIPILIDGAVETAGTSTDAVLTLGPIRQVAFLNFLGGFYDSLARFGLTMSTGVMEEKIAERIAEIYANWNAEVRLARPADFSALGYTTVEIGGADPNGIGLFGYDNSPGKDVGNLRLFDTIGGANAETQEDGYPGYGGVFVESLLYFSSHPNLPGARPQNAPDAESLFDEIFDPVRARPATLAEVRGEGDPTRVEQVARAIRAFAAIVGETAAHEFGHSLGMASPYGPPTEFHNATDEPGCLMDAGGARPLGERAREPGFPRTRLCHSHPEYLDEILGLE